MEITHGKLVYTHTRTIVESLVACDHKRAGAELCTFGHDPDKMVRDLVHNFGVCKPELKIVIFSNHMKVFGYPNVTALDIHPGCCNELGDTDVIIIDEPGQEFGESLEGWLAQRGPKKIIVIALVPAGGYKM